MNCKEIAFTSENGLYIKKALFYFEEKEKMQLTWRQEHKGIYLLRNKLMLR